MRVVLDVSSSLAWTRPPVGIVRAERKFAAFLCERAPVKTIFCRFDAPRACFVEVPADGLRSSSVDGVLPSGGRDDHRVRDAVASAARRGIEHLPARLQRDAEMLVKSVYWLGRGAWRELASRARRASPEPSSTAPVLFDPDDVYVSMGIDWQHNDLRALQRVGSPGTELEFAL